MNITQLLARFRQDSRDQTQPYLWSDAEVLSYIDDAQKQFCRLTGGIADATSTDCARIPLVAGQSFADLSPLVLKVRAAFDSLGKPLELVNMEDVEFGALSGEELFADTEGEVTTVVLGMEPDKIKVIHTPDEDQTINLIVYRLPLDDIVSTSSALEIQEQHHVHLLLWARAQAHLKSDAEAFDRGRSDQFRAEFERYCALAKDEKGRRDHKHRAVQFSFW